MTLRWTIAATTPPRWWHPERSELGRLSLRKVYSGGVDMHDEFIAAIHGRRMLRVTFTASGDGAVRTRRCAPMDFGPSRRSTDRSDRYHFWDYDSPDRSHTLSLFPEQLSAVEVLPDEFNPADFVTWTPNWFVPRDWGSFS